MTNVSLTRKLMLRIAVLLYLMEKRLLDSGGLLSRLSARAKVPGLLELAGFFLTIDRRTGWTYVADGPAAGLRVPPFLRAPVEGRRHMYAGLARSVEFARYEPESQAVFKEYCPRGAYVADIGANVGNLTFTLSAMVGREGRVLAFEPVPETAAMLEEIIAVNQLSNVEVIREAVTDRAGKLEIKYFAAGDPFAALSECGYEGPDYMPRDALVPSTSFDLFLEERDVARIDLVKIDAEGAELGILEGMRRTIELFSPAIYVEFVGVERITQGLAVLETLGYSGVERMRAPHSSGEDFVMILATRREKAVRDLSPSQQEGTA